MTILKNILGVVVLIGLVYGVSNYWGLITETVGVKGVRTDRAQEISNEISSDVGKQVDTAKEQTLQVKIGDIVNGLSRFQRIPRDIQGAMKYVQDQATNVLQSREK